MLCYDRIDVSEGVNVNKTIVSKECVVCHYWYHSFNQISVVGAMIYYCCLSTLAILLF